MCYCDKGTILGVCAAGHIGSNHSLPLFSPISLVVWPFVPSFLRRSRRDRDLLAGSNLLGARSADPPLSVGPGIDRHTHTTTRDAIKDPFSSSISIKRLVEGRQENKVLSLNRRMGIATGRFGERHFH